MSSAFAHNEQFHRSFSAASQYLQQQQLSDALPMLRQALQSAKLASNDAVLAANAQQHVVTTSLIIMGVLFRQQRHADTLRAYHELFHQLDDWLHQCTDASNKTRLRGYQSLAQAACKKLHLERLREEQHHVSSTK